MTRAQRIAAAIALGGLTAAFCDFLAAMGIYGLDAETVGHAVARGWFGKAAMQGGLDVALIGAASHLGICLGAAAVFVAASLKLPVLRRLAWITGPVFGAGVYLAMHFVIVPLSALHSNANPHGVQLALELGSHLFLVGLPIALWARRFLGSA